MVAKIGFRIANEKLRAPKGFSRASVGGGGRGEIYLLINDELHQVFKTALGVVIEIVITRWPKLARDRLRTASSWASSASADIRLYSMRSLE